MMHTIKLICILCTLAVTGMAQELPALKEEPDYRQSPRYLPLLFGESDADCVWLVLEGDRTLYVDRDMDGVIEPETEKFQVGSHPKFSSTDFFAVPQITNSAGEVVADSLTLTRYGTDTKGDIVKVLLPEKLPMMHGWRSMFEEDRKNAKAIRFSSSVSPDYLRSKEISMSDNHAEIHLCLSGKRGKDEVSGLVGIEAFPEKSIPVVTIYWPTDTKAGDQVTTEVRLTKRC